ncbi:IspA Geranylgeranyl pyrophosphate synthase [Burkholderiales bacterium]|jgi:geranylgeranyl diphosphate synthase type II
MLKERIDRVLMQVVKSSAAEGGPPKLAEAIHHAVFPGGARVRPQLCLAVALANGDDDPGLSECFAASLELMHCASLVHDDLPCFDNAALRRGLPSVHAAFGERLAVLAGDALIVMAFRAVIGSRTRHAHRLVSVLTHLEESVAPPFGIAAGQAWECEPRALLQTYQRSKTGALFAAATAGGAAAAGADPQVWRGLGEALGEAYQVADDIRDVLMDAAGLGKPANQDLLLDRPSAARELGLEGSFEAFDALIAKAIESIPPCRGAVRLRGMVLKEGERLLPLDLRSLPAVQREVH